MRLRHFYIKVGLFGLLLLFCILFGVSLASSGMERIEGPQPSSKAAPQVSPTKAPGKITTTVAKQHLHLPLKIQLLKPNNLLSQS